MYSFLDGISWYWTGLLLLVLSVIYFRQFTAIYSYWEKRNVIFEPPKSFWKKLSIANLKELHSFEMERYNNYGMIYGMFEGKAPVLNIADPDLIRSIMVKDFPAFPNQRKLESTDDIFNNMIFVLSGEKWKRIRSIISPAFATGKIKRMSNIIVNSAQRLVRLFAENAGTPLETKTLYNTFALDVIASVAFATKIHSYQDPNNRFIREANKFFPRSLNWRLLILFIFPSLAKYFIGNKSVTKFFKEETMRIIADRKKSGTTRNDFLQLLMEAEKETRETEGKDKDVSTEKKNVDDTNAEELGHEENNAQLFKLPQNFKSLSEDELVAQCVMFFIVGFSSIASTISYMTYALAINPDVQDKLKEEVDDVLRAHDKTLTYAAIQDMKYLDKVLSETLRHYPAVVSLNRVASMDYKLGNTGIVIEKDQLLSIPVYAIHHDPKYYPDPEKFDPERFSAEAKASRHPYSYLAFGAGPRNCVAMRFALMEIKFCIAYLISQLTVKRCAETKEPLELFTAFSLLEPKEVKLIFEVRKDRVFDGLQKNQENE